jgi:hypothetical protein
MQNMQNIKNIKNIKNKQNKQEIFNHVWFIKLLLFNSTNMCLKSTYSLLRFYLSKINFYCFYSS